MNPNIKSIQISITTKCHAKCRMCTVTIAKIPLFDMNIHLFTKILSDIEQMGIFQKGNENSQNHYEFDNCVGICGLGEPLEHKQFAEIADILGNSNIAWALGTNGLYLCGENLSSVIKNMPNKICISIDAMTKETFRKIRPGLRLDRIHENVRNFVKEYSQFPENTIIYLQIINFPVNSHEIQQWIDYYLNLIRDCPKFRLYIKQACKFPNSADDHGTFPSPNTVFKTYGDPRIIADNFSNKWSINPLTCQLPWEHITISSNGDVSPCCMDTNNEFVIGNVQDQSIIEIFQSESVELIRFRMRHGNIQGMLCEGCDKIYSQST